MSCGCDGSDGGKICCGQGCKCCPCSCECHGEYDSDNEIERTKPITKPTIFQRLIKFLFG